MIHPFNLSRIGANPLVRLGLSVAATVAVVWLLVHFLVGPQQARKEAAQAQTEAIVADTQAQAAQDTVRIVVDHAEAVQTITHRTEVTTREILAAPGASDRIDPALHHAGLRALCLHDNRRDASCADVLQSDAERDPTGTADPSRASPR